MTGLGAKGRLWARIAAVAVMVGVAAMVCRPVETFAASKVELAAAKKAPRGSVYLFLGLGNIFSTGLDQLAGELRARGVPAHSLNYAGWGGVAAQIEARYRKDKRALPVVIVGHSFGADAVLQMSQELARKGIPVALAVTFDATARIPVASSVRHFINFYAPSDGIGKKLVPGRGFRGRLENVNVDALNKGIDHFDIEKNPAFHRRVINEVLRLYGRNARVSLD